MSYAPIEESKQIQNHEISFGSIIRDEQESKKSSPIDELFTKFYFSSNEMETILATINYELFADISSILQQNSVTQDAPKVQLISCQRSIGLVSTDFSFMVELRNSSKHHFPPGCEIRLLNFNEELSVKPHEISEIWKSYQVKRLTIKARYPDFEGSTLADFGLFSAFG